MVFEWTDARVINLISSVKKIPPLYDRDHADYENKELKSQLWETAAKQLGATNRDCRRKWTGLCMKYNKLKEGASGMDNVEDWPWQEHMSFIDPDAIQKGSVNQTETSVGNASGAEVLTSGGAANKTHSIKDQSEAEPVKHAVKYVPIPIVSSFDVPNVSQPTRERSSEDSSRNVVSTTTVTPVGEQSLNGLEKVNEAQGNVNANRLFLESLVNDLSSLSVRDQYDFKVEVLILMRNYLLKNKI